MKQNDLPRRWRALGVVLTLLAAGCNAPIPEPETAYKDLPVQTYPFDVVWESLMASIQAEGFVVDSSSTERIGDERGNLTTLFKDGGKDPITKVESSQRVRGQVIKKAKKTYGVRVSASSFTRPTPDHEWDFAAEDPALVERIKTGLERVLRERYREDGR